VKSQIALFSLLLNFIIFLPANMDVSNANHCQGIETLLKNAQQSNAQDLSLIIKYQRELTICNNSHFTGGGSGGSSSGGSSSGGSSSGGSSSGGCNYDGKFYASCDEANKKYQEDLAKSSGGTKWTCKGQTFNTEAEADAYCNPKPTPTPTIPPKVVNPKKICILASNYETTCSDYPDWKYSYCSKSSAGQLQMKSRSKWINLWSIKAEKNPGLCDSKYPYFVEVAAASEILLGKEFYRINFKKNALTGAWTDSFTALIQKKSAAELAAAQAKND